jgi:thioredoxin-like negative regulator of GroEL
LKTKILIFGLLLLPILTSAQASINVEQKILETYGFEKPDPVPIIAENPKISPYFKFYDYQTKSEPKSWKVVTLENEYIQVMVLPEIGGKVWGAIEKSTGNEFLYKNEVIKFRNIAMRGPWTSGGIEFNFGIIGHHPSTATSVNYSTRSNPDGSVSCIVGNDDLPSNTHWEVEIRLAPNTAYFETHTSWYNAAPLAQSYYNWMTGAAPATYDLEFFIPGNAYVEHNGNAHSWPIDEKGRDLSHYKNNTFGPSKSYHIVGEYNNFFGGYYHDRQVGFGHWGLYEEIPGQKLWLWDLSRAGGIWEDLLTDTDGQYIEFQAGRMFDQYFPGAVNPISQYGFAPHLMDTWTEYWFPVKNIGGIEAVSAAGVLNVEYLNDTAEIHLNALQELEQELAITVDGKFLKSIAVAMKPMDVFKTTIPFTSGSNLEVKLENTELQYNSDPNALEIKRPFYPDPDLIVSQSQKLYQEALEAMEYREFNTALNYLETLTETDPSHREGLIKLAELYFRRAEYETALSLSNRVLKMDTYNANANYVAALCYKALGEPINALESAGWAARDMAYRSVAYDLMATLHLGKQNLPKATHYATQALDFNTKNLNALEVLLVVYRKNGNRLKFDATLSKIRKLKTLHHFSAVEEQLFDQENPELKRWEFLTNELPQETVLEIALRYIDLNLLTEAQAVLSQLPNNLKSRIWKAYLLWEHTPKEAEALLESVIGESVAFVFPFRRESLPVLSWAYQRNPHWKLGYLLAQNYIAIGQLTQGKALLLALKNTPDIESFYRFRAKTLTEASFKTRLEDFNRAIDLAPKDWKTWEEATQFALNTGNPINGLEISSQSYRRFKGNYSIGLAHAKALMQNGKFSETLQVLKGLDVLPYEHASESKSIYNEAHYGLILNYLKQNAYSRALSLLESAKLWPENLGVGKPFEPDERLEDFATAYIYLKTGQLEGANLALERVCAYQNANGQTGGFNALFRLLALEELHRHDELQLELNQLKKEAKQDSNANLLLEWYRVENESAISIDAKEKTNALALSAYLFQKSKF